ncbi:MAG: hypothetical protein H0X37_19465 [Herpetosiphonaceae bacterium]|nr:hypothetical protein [Herpetosiphonaceae bacterium]
MLIYPLRRYSLQSSICVLLLLVTSCGTDTTQNGHQSTSATTVPRAQMVIAPSPVRPLGLFAVDSLVRSTQLAGVDLHVRYLERTPIAIVLHIAFYNNGISDLAFVTGAPLGQAQLIGTTTATPTAISPSFMQGIAPPGTWLANSANNGTLSFPELPDDHFSFVFPGFPAIPIRLTLPLREAPEPPPAAPGQYRFAWEVAAKQQPGRVLRLTAAIVTTTTLTIEVRLLDRGSAAAQQPLLPRDIALFDGRWNQLRAETLTGTLQTGQAMGDNVILRFSRPAAGDVVLLQVPDVPLIRVPLHADDVPVVASQADLPPSAYPRPTPNPSTAPSLNYNVGQAWSDIQQLLDQANRAVTERDRVAYLGVWGPELQQSQSAAFDQIMQLPLQDIQWTLVSTPDGGSTNGDRVALDAVPVTLHYAIKDVDPANVFVNDLQLSFRHDTTWHITAVAGDLPFWIYAAAAAERVGSFWIFFRPAARTELPALAEEARRSFEQVERALPGRTKAVNVMFVTSTADEFTTLTGRPADRFAGVALSRYQIGATGVSITNQAFFLNGAAFQQPQSQNREQTITHEFTHLVLAPTTMPFVPAWLVEGAAMDVSADFPHATLTTWLQTHPEGMKLDDFSAVTSFGQGDDSEQTLVQYAYAAYLAKYLIEVYGMQRFLALYDSFSATPLTDIQAALAPTTDAGGRNAALSELARHLTPLKIQTVLGSDLPTLEHNFNVWLSARIKNDQ